ncbi:MAG: helix-turn-helix domain-containing protein [Bacteroidales bacterium]|nr:helix-turn-helix domain-containing protein [Bacteroidales bacterium]
MHKQQSHPLVAGYKLNNPASSFLYEGNEVVEIADKLLELYEFDKPYLKAGFKLSELVNILGTNRNYLSRTINNYLRINFNQLNNYYRVREACLVFLDNTDITFKDWMERAGFCSSSSFSGCFSYYVGISPVRWRKEVLQRMKRGEKVSADDYIKDFRYRL